MSSNKEAAARFGIGHIDLALAGHTWFVTV